MGEVFLKVLNMSIAASWLILAVMLLRLVLKRVPKWIYVILWGIAALRLAVPFSFESALSLIPSAETFNAHNIQFEMPAISSGIPAVNNAVNPVLGEMFAPNPGGSVNPLYVWTFVVSVIWLIGISAMLIYAVISYVRVHRSVAERVPYEENIFLCDHLKSPFILGLVKPKIYLPSNMDAIAIEPVIAHEKAHLARHDHWWKPIGFLILMVHWFNPLCWIAYVMLCRDIELACDEKVIRQMDLDGKKQYSTALLECSTGRQLITICPLAFGEIGVKERVKNVLNYKKPAFWIVLIAVIVCVAVAVCFLTNPVTAEPGAPNATIPVMQNVVREIGRGSLHTGVELSTDDAKAIAEIIDNGTWIEETMDCEMNCSINLNGRLYYYSSDCGTLEELDVSEMSYLSAKVPKMNNKSLKLSDTQKDIVNAILEKYISLDSDVVSQENPPKIEELRVKYPEYFELGTFKGLEVYVWQMAENDYRFGLMQGTNREKTPEEKMALKGATAGEMALILSTFGIEKNNIFVIPWQNPISSYMVTEEMAKDPEYINNIRAMLGLDGASVSSAGGEDTPIAVKPDVTAAALSEEQTAIRRAILDHNRSKDPTGFVSCASFVELAAMSGTPLAGSSTHKITYYGWALYEEYKVTDGGLETVRGSHIPVALSFNVDDSGYTLTEYWEPREGGYYAQDIRKKFPANVAEDGINSQKFIFQQKQECYVQAAASAGLNTNKVIGTLIETICSSPDLSSDPEDYIDQHSIEYRELTYYGRYTLQYCFARFEKGSETGLDGQIMMRACGDIAALWGEEPLIFNLPANGVLTGQMWYSAFKNNALNLMEQYNKVELAERYPASYLLLSMLGKV